MVQVTKPTFKQLSPTYQSSFLSFFTRIVVLLRKDCCPAVGGLQSCNVRTPDEQRHEYRWFSPSS